MAKQWSTLHKRISNGECIRDGTPNMPTLFGEEEGKKMETKTETQKNLKGSKLYVDVPASARKKPYLH